MSVTMPVYGSNEWWRVRNEVACPYCHVAKTFPCVFVATKTKYRGEPMDKTHHYSRYYALAKLETGERTTT